jgi:hypothetical protein
VVASLRQTFIDPSLWENLTRRSLPKRIMGLLTPLRRERPIRSTGRTGMGLGGATVATRRSPKPETRPPLGPSTHIAYHQGRRCRSARKAVSFRPTFVRWARAILRLAIRFVKRLTTIYCVKL